MLRLPPSAHGPGPPDTVTLLCSHPHPPLATRPGSNSLDCPNSVASICDSSGLTPSEATSGPGGRQPTSVTLRVCCGLCCGVEKVKKPSQWVAAPSLKSATENAPGQTFTRVVSPTQEAPLLPCPQQRDGEPLSRLVPVSEASPECDCSLTENRGPLQHSLQTL